ncbi:hypothetical protein T10_4483 [Trichinella papuae]|uniref:Uncharacterized protein n=1 Tax=Trichinella papuae TaxID=268474 RepID=A0A0V1LZC4_9BILA|nr:hypothetical protein T10_4483 [Trichinella papuae]
MHIANMLSGAVRISLLQFRDNFRSRKISFLIFWGKKFFSKMSKFPES